MGNRDKEKRNLDLYEEILLRLENYKKSLENVGFASYEMSQLHKPENEADLLELLDVVFESSKELNYILEEAPNSFFVCDQDAICLRVNKAYEKMVKMSKHEILGKNMSELDSRGVFRPSVCWLVLREKRPISVLQEIRNVNNMAVTGVPVFDENGNIFRAVTNAIKVDEVEPVAEYFSQKQQMVFDNNQNMEIIAASEDMLKVIKLADMIKDTESNVLITGETGVGKGVLASYIHKTSIRGTKRMVSINCGAIPENLLESELFGYESGAFTGADKKGKPGLIEISSGGTLFLDEISELPLMLQVKILHFLQTKKMTRVGGTKEIRIDTRIIAASNKNLEEEVRRGTFRADLYYRINVIPIRIPPLRERREDIQAIADFFLAFYGKKYKKKIKMEPETLEYIMNHEWKGNVRELENYIERLVVTNDSGWFLDMEKTNVAIEDNKSEEEVKEKNLNERMEDAEKEAIIEAYEKYKSSYKVARELGISQSTAYRRIKKYMNESDE